MRRTAAGNEEILSRPSWTLGGSTNRTLVAVAVVAVVATVAFAALYFTKDPRIEAASTEQCGDRIFGHISSLTRKGDHYEMRFDPAWFTSGVTANTAAAEDGVVEPGEAVPNDNYRIEEGHRLLTYLVPMDAQVSVLTRKGTLQASERRRFRSLSWRSSCTERSRSTLFEPLDTGVWIRVHIDTVCTLDHQYQP